MTLIVPTERGGLPAIIESLTPEILESLLSASHGRMVRLALPRFELTPRPQDMVAALRTLGVDAAFDGSRADFGGLVSTPVHVSRVVHTAMLRVDERGTVAASASSAEFLTSGLPPEPVEVIADHPFLAVIHFGSSHILFVAVVNNPSNNG